MTRQRAAKLVLWGLLIAFFCPWLAAQQAGETIAIREPAKEDLYLAGRNVDVLAAVEGDLVAAGERITVTQTVSGDVIAAGAQVTVQGRVGDDARLAGGTVTVTGPVGDDALLAGGSVSLGPAASVGGRAWLAGRDIEVDGRIAKELKAAGQHIVIAGEVQGDALLAGERITLLAGARIAGKLLYKSPNPATIDSAAQVGGAIRHEPLELPRPIIPLAAVAGTLGLSLIISAVVLLLLFPGLYAAVAESIDRDPFKCLGLGFTVLVVTPAAVVALMVTVLGIPLALALLALYGVFLLIGFLAGVFYLGERLLRGLRRGKAAGKGWRVIALIVAFLVLGLVQIIPIAGALILLFLFLFGLGGLSLRAYRLKTAAPA